VVVVTAAAAADDDDEHDVKCRILLNMLEMKS